MDESMATSRLFYTLFRSTFATNPQTTDVLRKARYAVKPDNVLKERQNPTIVSRISSKACVSGARAGFELVEVLATRLLDFVFVSLDDDDDDLIAIRRRLCMIKGIFSVHGHLSCEENRDNNPWVKISNHSGVKKFSNGKAISVALTVKQPLGPERAVHQYKCVKDAFNSFSYAVYVRMRWIHGK